jgi:uncharacterized membrane protein
VEFKQIRERKIIIIIIIIIIITTTTTTTTTTICDKFSTASHASRVGYDLFL